MKHQNTCISTICSKVCSGWQQMKDQVSLLLAFCEGNPPIPGGFPKGPNLRIAFPCRDVIMEKDFQGCFSRNMMTSSNGNIFGVTGPLCGEFTRHRWIPLTKASDVEYWCFLWSAPWINDSVNNRETGDLRRHLTHYDVTVMSIAGANYVTK